MVSCQERRELAGCLYADRMIRHIVLVKTQGTAAAAQLELAFQQIGQVVDRLPGALSVAYGPSNSPEQLERGYTHGLVIDFTDSQALHDYAVDAGHVAAGALIGQAAGGQDGLLVVDLEVANVPAA
jgi:hypothetical protein